MIQDLKPYTFYNEYRQSEPGNGDIIISISDRRILIKEENGNICFPTYEELLANRDAPESENTEDVKLLPAAEQEGSEHPSKLECTYLFAIDQTQFFLCWNVGLEGYEYQTMQYLRGASPKHLAYAGMVAMQLADWHESHRFCGRCGHEMEHSTKERMMHCPECGQMEYPKICPCVIVGVIHGDKILVTKYRGRKTKFYALVAGFAEVGETIEETVHREVFEETGVHVKNLSYYKCQPWPFSESLLFGFFCELEGSDAITMEEDELSLAKWISRDELDVTCDDFALTNEMLWVFKENKLDFLKRE